MLRFTLTEKTRPAELFVVPGLGITWSVVKCIKVLYQEIQGKLMFTMDVVHKASVE